MSKRHQASRRRSYGRRQHELHEREAPPSLPGAARARDRRRRCRRPRAIRSPSWIRGLRGSATRWASRDGRLRRALGRNRLLPGPRPPSRGSGRTVEAPRPRRRPGASPVEPPVRSCSAAIVIAFVLAFFSLAQSVRVSATGYDINRLLTERDALLNRKQDLLSDLNRLGREPAIRKQSIDAGLGQLDEPVVLSGR